MTRRPTTPRNSRTRTRVQANAKQSPPPPEPGLDLEIMTITPELAQEWLDRGGTNRKTTRRRIEAMTAAIQRGEWQLTGEAIKLYHEGRVRDGQNRLHAIVEAGIPVRSVVARGVSEDAFDVMDTGRSRNAADVLHPRLSIPECHGRRRARIDVHRTLRTGVPQPAKTPANCAHRWIDQGVAVEIFRGALNTSLAVSVAVKQPRRPLLIGTVVRNLNLI